MANVLDDLAIYLQDTAGLGTIGAASNPPVRISKGFLTTNPDQQIALVEGFGQESLDTLGQIIGRVNVERPTIQALCRHDQDDYESARNLCESVYLALHGVVDTVINGTRYLNIEALSPPTNAGQDENGRWKSSVNFLVWKEKNS